MTKARRLENLWSHIHCLGILADTGSFTATARRLQISKASVSQKIAELEAATGVALVRRTTRSVGLTDAGRHLVDQTADAYLRIEAGFCTVQDLADTPRGVLSVTAPVAVGRQMIAPLVPVFLQRYPDVRIQLELNDRLSSLATDGFDLAIRHAAELPDTHVASVICETRSVLVASRAYLQQYGTPQTPTQLSAYNCLHYMRRTGVTTWSFVSHQDGKRLDVPVRGNFTANNSEVLREAAAGSLGIALLPDFSAIPALRDATLVEVLPDWRIVGGFAQRLYAVRPAMAHVPRSVSAFIHFLREMLPKYKRSF